MPPLLVEFFCVDQPLDCQADQPGPRPMRLLRESVEILNRLLIDGESDKSVGAVVVIVCHPARITKCNKRIKRIM